MHKLIVICLFATTGTALAADWELSVSTDAMTDEVTRQAYVIAQGGEKFTVMRKSDGSVWGYVQLSGVAQFGVDDSLMVRVDKNEPREFDDRLQRMTLNIGTPIQTWEWNPNLVGFRMWHGKVNEGCGFIEQLFHGKQLVVRYSPNQSTFRDITFLLSGNQSAIPEALGFDIASCPAGEI